MGLYDRFPEHNDQGQVRHYVRAHDIPESLREGEGGCGDAAVGVDRAGAGLKVAQGHL